MEKRVDNAKVKRVELHAHTKMSAMDGCVSAAELVRRAAELGHAAVAITDHGVVQAFPEAMNEAERCAAEGKPIRVLYGVEAYLDAQAGETGRPYHVTLLAKNRQGLKQLYKLITFSHTENFCRRPRITRAKLEELREGLLVGSACEMGELFQAVMESKPWDELRTIAGQYDYLELQPLGNNAFLLHNGTARDEEQLREWNRTVIRLGEELDIPVCATGDVHFLEPEDEIYRRILQAAQGFDSADRQPPLYLHTTEEMLAEFAYLTPEKAYEIVVENPNRIAQCVEKLTPVPTGYYLPEVDNAAEELAACVRERAKALYGEPLPATVAQRLTRELESVLENGFAGQYVIARRLVQGSEENGYTVGARGAVGSSFVAYLAGITDINPLAPHYVCPQCKYSEFIEDGSVRSGFDLPEKVCPGCGAPLRRDGHELPFEMFAGFDYHKLPDIDLNFASQYQMKAVQQLWQMFGKERVVKGGTVSTLWAKSAAEYVERYAEEHGQEWSRDTIRELADGLTGIKRTTGQHPGGMVILPKGYEWEDFCPLQYPGNTGIGEYSTHFDFHALIGTLYKQDALGHLVPSILKYLEEDTGVRVAEVPMSDPEVYRLLTTPEPLGVTAEDIDCETGTLSLPELGHPFVQGLLQKCRPATFADLLQISGLSHGTDVWTGNAQELIENGKCTLSEAVALRDDVFLQLVRRGVEPARAFKIMEATRKGRAAKLLTEDDIAALRACGVPEWYVECCKKVRYMFPKAHAVAYCMAAVRLGWYKLYRPVAYYAAYFTARDVKLDELAFGWDIQKIKSTLDELRSRDADSLSYADRDRLSNLHVAYEALRRGVEFLPVDLYRSPATRYTVEDGKLRLPLCAVNGVGPAAAAAIVQQREKGAFVSEEELCERTGLSESGVTALMLAGALPFEIEDLPF